MTRDQVLEALAGQKTALNARGAAATYLFGSAARDEATEASDIDLFIDVAPGRKFSLIDLAGIHRILSEAMPMRIDLTTREGLHPKLRAQIEREAIRVF
jgi:uncharacterized protein